MAGALAYATAYPDWEPAEPGSARRHVSLWRVAVVGLGAGLTAAACAALWVLLAPLTVVQTRFVADGGGAMARSALAEAALRLGAAASLTERGDALLVTVSTSDPVIAWLQARSLANAVLDLPAGPDRAQSAAVPSPAPPSDPRALLQAERARLQAEADAIESRLATASASMSAVVRDIAAASRDAADHKTGHEILDHAQAALADLQLQRIKLQSRYQDDFPAIGVVDAQIKAMRGFIQDETHRLDSSAAAGAGSADAALAAERDRLRGEMAQLEQRRVAVMAEMAALGHGGGVAAAPLPPALVPAAALPPVPVLIEGATTLSWGADLRWLALPAASLTGLLLSLLAWFMPRRRASVAVEADLLLRRIESGLLQAPTTPALPGGGYTALPALRSPEDDRPLVGFGAKPRATISPVGGL
jgi:hypothetical protein